MRIPCVFLLTLLLQACAATSRNSSPDEYVAPHFAAPSKGALFVLLPAKNSSRETKSGEALVIQQLHAQLTGLGYKVVALDAANFAVLWEQEIQSVGGLYDPVTGAPRTGAYARAIGALAQRVAFETHSTLVISPGLVVRQANLSGTIAAWDGQERTQPTARTYGSDYRFTGTTSALSVELLAVSSDGAIAFKTFGGTSLPYRADGFSGQYEIRENLFSSDIETAEGVRIALRPLIGK
jgi:hypothetical protein